VPPGDCRESPLPVRAAEMISRASGRRGPTFSSNIGRSNIAKSSGRKRRIEVRPILSIDCDVGLLQQREGEPMQCIEPRSVTTRPLRSAVTPGERRVAASAAARHCPEPGAGREGGRPAKRVACAARPFTAVGRFRPATRRGCSGDPAGDDGQADLRPEDRGRTAVRQAPDHRRGQQRARQSGDRPGPFRRRIQRNPAAVADRRRASSEARPTHPIGGQQGDGAIGVRDDDVNRPSEQSPSGGVALPKAFPLRRQNVIPNGERDR
jgi:hypothetical protein